MRKASFYGQPKFRDPNDLRLVKIIKGAKHAMANAVNVLGVPYDGAVLGRKGASGGPRAIRDAMSGFSNFNVELGMGLEDARVFDIGDVVLGEIGVKAAHRSIEKEVAGNLRAGSLLVALGGDNSISLPGLRAFTKKFGDVGLVYVDSHLDLRGEILGRPTSGSSYGIAVRALKGLNPQRVAQIGAHGFLNSSAYAKDAKRLGLQIFTAKDVERKGPTQVAREAFEKASSGAEAVYLSVDMDAVDLGEVSGVSAPSAGGISARELFEILYEMAQEPKVTCADLVEVAPNLDPTGRTQIVAASALAYLIAGFQARSGR